MRLSTTLLAVLTLAAVPVLATNARVESMGKTPAFFMDDVSIFENPANINIYPNFLIGEPGHITEFSDSSTNSKNLDPSEPYGGGLLSFSLNKDKSSESRYPMWTVGAMLNHKSELVDVLMNAAAANGHVIPMPKVPNSDFFLGYTFENGTMVGGHFYAARQSIEVTGDKFLASRNELNTLGITTGNTLLDDTLFGNVPGTASESYEWTSGVYKGDLGVNMPLSQNMDLEVAFGLAVLEYSGSNAAYLRNLAIENYGDDDLSFFVSARLFSTLLSLNGEIVPILKFKKIAVRNYEVNEVNVGVGANVTLDRGFFWSGLELVNSGKTIPVGLGQTRTIDEFQVPFSFGIERNVVWEWLVLRVGFRKVIYGNSTKNGLSQLETNAEADMTSGDHVGGGIGINIEEKLKIDATMAEDFLFKWGNLISGNSHHVFTRITATYSF